MGIRADVQVLPEGPLAFTDLKKVLSELKFDGGECASIMVTSKTAGKKIMVERSMYWNNRGAGTDTIGGYPVCQHE